MDFVVEVGVRRSIVHLARLTCNSAAGSEQDEEIQVQGHSLMQNLDALYIWLCDAVPVFKGNVWSGNVLSVRGQYYKHTKTINGEILSKVGHTSLQRHRHVNYAAGDIVNLVTLNLLKSYAVSHGEIHHSG